MKTYGYVLWAILSVFSFAIYPCDAQDSHEALAKAAQNPLANMINLPIQSNTYFDVGPNHNQVASITNIQPVIPTKIGNYILINRPIIPIMYIPDLTQGLNQLPNHAKTGSKGGLGDIIYQGFFTSAKPGKLTWGVGPEISIPTATDERLGSGKLSLGPAAVGLYSTGPWLFGGIVNNIWSIAGASNRDHVNKFLLQPFINYNLPGGKGWYLTSSPIMTANWVAKPDDRWTVPIGGGIGKIFHIGTQAMNAQLQGFSNVEHPHFGPDWTLRVQVQFLFPIKK